MANLSEESGRAIGDILVRTYPAGRARIEQVAVPEIAAWLMMHGNRAEAMFQQAFHYSRSTSDTYLKNLQRAMECRKDCIQMLINCLTDKFSRTDYWKAWEQICTDFKIVYDDNQYNWMWEGYEYEHGGGI